MESTQDDLLKQVIRYLMDRWLYPKVGIVASGIFDPRHPPIMATSEQLEGGVWLHAERSAIQRFENKYSSIGSDAILVVTLSPCSRANSNTRMGSSCLEFIRAKGIKRIHIGAHDISQGNINITDYESYGITLTFAQDPICKTICSRLYAIFKIMDNV